MTAVWIDPQESRRRVRAGSGATQQGHRWLHAIGDLPGSVDCDDLKSCCAPNMNRTHASFELDNLGIATLTVTQAGSLNLLGSPAIADLRAAVAEARDDKALRVLVMRGSGDKAFIGGADIHEMSTLTPPAAQRFIGGLRDLCEEIRRVPVPVVARLPGWTLGGGLEVAMACDLRICSEDARFGMPEVRVGIPSVIHAALLPRLIGQSPAAWMLLTGESIDAATALSWGLVHRRVALSDLDTAVDDTARSLAGLGERVLRQQKRLLRSWEQHTLDDSIAASVAEFSHSFETGEPQRYMTAFLNRPR
jgi:enoyl-CoA hydratase